MAVPHAPAGVRDRGVYKAAREAGVINHVAPRIEISTNLNLPVWRAKATGHQSDEWILAALAYGFPIQYQGPPCFKPVSLYNHLSATRHADTIRKYISKETEMGALHGPYDTPPFTPWMVVSPKMTREKPDSKERKVIVDLSYPDGGLNAHIQPHIFNEEEAIDQLPTTEYAFSAIARMCPGEVQLAVIDLSRAYCQFPVPPTDWPLLGIYYDHEYYFDGRIPFGARMSSYAMQSIAGFITRALEVMDIVSFMYLDDIVIIAASRPPGSRAQGTAPREARHMAQHSA